MDHDINPKTINEQFSLQYLASLFSAHNLKLLKYLIPLENVTLFEDLLSKLFKGN